MHLQQEQVHSQLSYQSCGSHCNKCSPPLHHRKQLIPVHTRQPSGVDNCTGLCATLCSPKQQRGSLHMRAHTGQPSSIGADQGTHQTSCCRSLACTLNTPTPLPQGDAADKRPGQTSHHVNSADICRDLRAHVPFQTKSQPTIL